MIRDRQIERITHLRPAPACSTPPPAAAALGWAGAAAALLPGIRTRRLSWAASRAPCTARWQHLHTRMRESVTLTACSVACEGNRTLQGPAGGTACNINAHCLPAKNAAPATRSTAGILTCVGVQRRQNSRPAGGSGQQRFQPPRCADKQASPPSAATGEYVAQRQTRLCLSALASKQQTLARRWWPTRPAHVCACSTRRVGSTEPQAPLASTHHSQVSALP